MLEFSEVEAGYIISQKALEDSVGYRYEDKPEFFEFYRADVYRLVQQGIEKFIPHLNLKVYPALDFKGFVVLDPETLTSDEIRAYHDQRDRLLRFQARQDIQRSEL